MRLLYEGDGCLHRGTHHLTVFRLPGSLDTSADKWPSDYNSYTFYNTHFHGGTQAVYTSFASRSRFTSKPSITSVVKRSHSKMLPSLRSPIWQGYRTSNWNTGSLSISLYHGRETVLMKHTNYCCGIWKQTKNQSASEYRPRTGDSKQGIVWLERGNTSYIMKLKITLTTCFSFP